MEKGLKYDYIFKDPMRMKALIQELLEANHRLEESLEQARLANDNIMEAYLMLNQRYNMLCNQLNNGSIVCVTAAPIGQAVV